MIKQRKGVAEKLKPGVKKRKRDITPPEQLSPDRERIFEDNEHRVFQRNALDDSSYKASFASDLESS